MRALTGTWDALLDKGALKRDTLGWQPFSQNVPMLAYTMLPEAYRPREQGWVVSCAAHPLKPLA